MNNFKTSTQNFDFNYIYKVEETEVSEKIIRQSAKGGLLLIENNALPKVTRYFLKNNKGERQGYIEKKFQNFEADTSEDEEFNPLNSKSEKIMLEPHSKNHKMRITPKKGKRPGNCSSNPKRFYRSCERCRAEKIDDIVGCDPLHNIVFNHSKNYTLDFTSPNSTPSDRTFDIKNTDSTADTVTERKIEQNPTKEKVFPKMSTKKSQRIFCKDPNRRLKNLFTIVKPDENLKEIRKCDDNVDLLNRTKKLLMQLIDKELQRTQSDHNATKNVKQLQLKHGIDRSFSKKLKLECVRKIEDELRLMKRLQNY